MRRLLKWLSVFCLVLVLAVGGLLFRLSMGPLSLAPLQPILDTLVARGAPFNVTFTQPSLVWLPQQGTIALEIRDVEARTSEGAFVGSAPLLRGKVAVRALLLHQQLDLVEAQLDLPGIDLTRDADGQLVLSFGGKLAAMKLGDTGGNEGLDNLLGGASESSDPRLAALRLVRVTAPSLQFVDAVSKDRTTAADPVFELERVNGIWTASLSGRLGDGRIEAIGEPAATPPMQQVTIQFQHLRAKDFAAFAPDVPLAGATVPISGTVAFTIDPATGERGAGTVDLTAEAGEIGVATLGLAPIAIKGASLRGSFAPGWRSVQIERCQLATEGYTLGAAGTVGEGDKGFDADVTLDADRLDVAEILQLWPESVAGDARKWVVANVPVGQVSAAKFQLSSRSTRPGQPEIGGQLGFSGVELRYVDTMLPATGLSGSASLAGNSLEFKIATGRTGEVDLSKGDAVLTNLFVEQPTGLRVAANLSSTVPAAMRLLDAEPVALRKATGLSADNAAGQQTTAFELALPLLDKIPPEKIRFKATTQLTNVELRQAAPGYDLAAQRLAVVAEPAAITAKGDVRVNGVPITVDVRENTPPVRGVQRTVKASGTIDAAGARALAVDWPKEIGGAVGFDATLVEARNPLRTIDVALDLRQTAFSLASAVLVKHAGQAGSASARLVQADAKSLAVQNAVIDVAGWRAEGETDLGLEPLQPRRVLLRQLRGPLGDLTADLALDGSRWRGRVDIGRLDVRPLLQEQ